MAKYIALAEDDIDDQLLFTEALRHVCKETTLATVPNATLLLKLLRDHNDSLPDMIILDVNMPGMSGIECLSVIRQTPVVKNIPVVIMSTSTNPQTIDQAYLTGANYYVCKPAKFEDLKLIVEKILTTDYSAKERPSKNEFLLQPKRAIL